jgi:hypothetical protein
MNHILGAKYIVMASAPGRNTTIDAWKGAAELLTKAMEVFRPTGLSFGLSRPPGRIPLDRRPWPIEVIAENTPKDFMLQLEVGTCVEVGEDPVAAPVEGDKGEGDRALLGEGQGPWKKIFDAGREDRRRRVLPDRAGRIAVLRVRSCRALFGAL